MAGEKDNAQEADYCLAAGTVARVVEGLLIAWVFLSVVLGVVLGVAFRRLGTQDPPPELIDDADQMRAPFAQAPSEHARRTHGTITATRSVRRHGPSLRWPSRR